jgi:CheY-specific phosphatase CheX
MTMEALQEILAAAASEVLETMFFAEVAAGGTPPRDGFEARVEFRGPTSGCFQLALDGALARGFASTFLAVEEGEVTTGRASEVVCEMANMLCGSALSRAVPDARFDLLQPVMAPPGSGRGVMSAFDCDGSALALWIDFRPAL